MSTWNTSDVAFGVLTWTNGNLTVQRSGGGNWVSTEGTLGRSTGKKHFEVNANVSDNLKYGLFSATARSNNLGGSVLYFPGQDANSVGVSVIAGGGSNLTYAVEVDFSALKWWYGLPAYPTWNPATGFSGSLLQVTNISRTGQRSGGGGNWTGGKTFNSKSSGLLHMEFTYVSGTPSTNIVLGATTSGIDFVNNLVYPGQDTSKGFGYQSNGTTYGCGGLVMPSCAVSDVIALEVDFTNGKAWFQNSSNGLWNNDVIGNQNPATNTGGFSLSGISGALFPSGAWFTTGILIKANTGGESFSITPSSGFSGWDASAPASVFWNGDVIANQNPASATGGSSISGLTLSAYPAVGIFLNTYLATAQFAEGAGFSLPLSSGFSGWDDPDAGVALPFRRRPGYRLIR